ncbi:MAG: threonine synthase [Thaumarchaeota archaeon]|nr:threonine synthase [Nitrososphaerota archaeon]
MQIPSQFWLRCMACASTFDSDSRDLTCPKCGSPLEALYEYERLRSAHTGVPSVQGVTSIWRFAPILPITERTKVVTLGEGGTPLVKADRICDELGVRDLYVKDESRNPTLSFKDRKSSVGITKALEFGSKAVASITAGNAGSSIAAYASKAGIESYIFTFRGISNAKLAKLVSYGGRVFKSNATSPELLEFCREVCKEYGFTNLTAASRYNPYIKEGAKTAIFEIFEALGGRLPDWLILPIGGGGNLSSYFKGARELKELGLIERFPKFVGVQGKYCAPVVKAFEKKMDPKEIPTIRNAKTVAHSILDEWAPDGDQALRAIIESDGRAVGVTDSQIMESMRMMSSKEGLFVEPASAAPLAAVKQLLADGVIGRDESVVLVATGFGSNQPEATLQAWGLPPAVTMNLKAFRKHVAR